MIALAIVLFYRAPAKAHLGLTSTVLVIHLLANFVWTYLFFGLRSPAVALVDLIVIDLSLMLLLRWFWQARRACGLLLTPYLLWVLFATYLNAGFWRLN
jgi:tryptophan-rich sensory protein